MNLDFSLNVLDAVLIIGIAIPSVVMAAMIKQPRLRMLTVLLAGFLVFHGLYHATAALAYVPGASSLGQLSDLFFEPVGWVILFAFMLYFARSTA